MSKLLGAVAVVALICVAVTGCSERKVATTKQPTVESAKAAVLAEEKRLVSFLPSQYVERLDQLNTAHLLSCTGGGYTWPDQAEVTLKVARIPVRCWMMWRAAIANCLISL